MAWDSLQDKQVLQGAPETEDLDFTADLLAKLLLDSLNALFAEFDGTTQRAIEGPIYLFISPFKDEYFAAPADDTYGDGANFAGF